MGTARQASDAKHCTISSGGLCQPLTAAAIPTMDAQRRVPSAPSTACPSLQATTASTCKRTAHLVADTTASVKTTALVKVLIEAFVPKSTGSVNFD